MRIGMRVATPEVRNPSLHYSSGDLAHTLASLAHMGYDSVELDIKDPREVDVKQMHRLLNDNGLDWCGIGTGRMLVEDGLSFTDPQAAVRKEAVRRMCGLIELGAEFGAIPMVGLARHDNKGLNDAQTSWAWMMEGLAACAEQAERCSHLAMLENITRYMHPVMHTVAQVISVLDEINSPAIRLMYDTYHAFLEERSLYGSLVAAGPRLCYVHASDGNREAPGWGLIDYSEVVGVLKALGYDGPVVCEVLMTPDAETVARHSIQFLDGLFKKHNLPRYKRV